MSDDEHLRRAIALARAQMEAGQGGPFGALIVKDGRVVAEGWNQVTSSADPTAHAEVVAIRRACAALGDFKLEGCVLYTSCEPCPMCLGAAYWAGVARIVFAAGREDAAAAGFSDEFLYRELPLPVDQRSIPTEQRLAAEGQGPFQAWLAKEDRVPY
ncbi:MAG: nucleoside deaminase [Planctomycetota bacterium]